MSQTGQFDEIIADAIDKRSPCFLSASGVSTCFETLLLHRQGQKLIIENTVLPEYIRKFVAAENHTLQVGMTRISCKGIESDGEHILFDLVGNIEIAETRRAERFSFSSDEKVDCRIVNPFDPETILIKPILDMSVSGVSIATKYDSSFFTPGMILPQTEIWVEGAPYKKGSGEVVYKRRLVDRNGKFQIQVGIKFN